MATYYSNWVDVRSVTYWCMFATLYFQSTWCNAITSSVDVSRVFNQHVDMQNLVELFIPTSNKIVNEKCKNHSTLYLEEVRNFTLWATEMFDATSKFPSGILVGSTYEMGNFDECIQVQVSLEDDEFSGKYCLAKLTIEPPKSAMQKNEGVYFYSDDPSNNYQDFNVSAWEKIMSLSKDRSKRLRNEIHWAFCIPSSCTNEDLEAHLTQLASVYNAMQNFKVTPQVDSRSCQIKNTFQFNAADITFLIIVSIFILAVGVATSYDLITGARHNRETSGTLNKTVLSLSVVHNLNKIVNHSPNKDGLDCINGMKVLSMFLIIMGHRIMFMVGSPLANSDYVESFYSKIEAMVLLNGPIIVDTFFNISGFLACYLLLSEFYKAEKNVKFVMLYIHRFLRLTPAYAVVLAFYCTLFVKLGSGPLWEEKVGIEQHRCLSSWWANLLYINNYVNVDKICMFQSWYITCDMHFFLFTPWLVWLLYKKPNLGISILIGIIATSIVSTFLVAYILKLDAILLLYMKVLKDPIADNTFRNIYIPTHTRASPYFVGMITGYIKYKIKNNNYKFSNRLVWITWILCIIIMEGTVYSAYVFYIPATYNAHASAIYAAFHHFLWSICISWFILAFSTGNGTWIEPILSWKGLVPLSRITYSAFLCHGAIQLYSAATLRQPAYASIFNLTWYTLGDIALAYTCGLLLCLFFESPIIALEKLLFKRRINRDNSFDNRNNNSIKTNVGVPKLTLAREIL